MTSSPHRDVAEGFGTLTSVSTSLQYCDGRVRGLVETCVDGCLSLLNYALGTKAQYKQVRFCDLRLTILALPLPSVSKTMILTYCGCISRRLGTRTHISSFFSRLFYSGKNIVVLSICFNALLFKYLDLSS
jgi:hypothetical protein